MTALGKLFPLRALPLFATAPCVFQNVSASLARVLHNPVPILESVVRQDIVGLADRCSGLPAHRVSLRLPTPRIVALETAREKKAEG